MVERRELMTGGVAAGLGALLGAASPVPAEGSSAQAPQANDAVVARAIDALRTSLERQQVSTELGPSTEITQIRRQQRTFLLANQKYPDFIDVGIDVWERVYDWHVKYRQPIVATRTVEGRYGLTFMFTTLLLRVEQTPGYVSFGYDR